MSPNKINKISKYMIDPTFREEITQETDNKIGVLTDSVDDHKVLVASPTTLGHVKVGANLSIDADGKLSADASESYALTDGAYVFERPTNDFNTLLETGFYNMSPAALNAPKTINSGYSWIVSVIKSKTGNPIVGSLGFVRQTASSTVLPEIYQRDVIPGVGESSWVQINAKLNDTLTSTSTTEAATANAVRQVNDKLGSNGVTIGLGASGTGTSASVGGQTSSGNYSVAVGYGAKAPGNDSIALGSSSNANAVGSVAIGEVSSSLNINTGVLGTPASYASKWLVPGTFSVTGTKQFEMPHPHPDKEATHVIRHASVESPTAGDTLYRYTLEASTDGQIVEILLPDYFQYLNKDVDVYVNGDKHFGNAYGEVIDDLLKVTCQLAGSYKVLVIGTRNDSHESIQNWSIKGVEREIGESWDGETYVFEDDEILTENEYLEATV